MINAIFLWKHFNWSWKSVLWSHLHCSVTVLLSWRMKAKSKKLCHCTNTSGPWCQTRKAEVNQKYNTGLNIKSIINNLSFGRQTCPPSGCAKIYRITFSQEINNKTVSWRKSCCDLSPDKLIESYTFNDRLVCLSVASVLR